MSETLVILHTCTFDINVISVSFFLHLW